MLELNYTGNKNFRRQIGFAIYLLNHRLTLTLNKVSLE